MSEKTNRKWSGSILFFGGFEPFYPRISVLWKGLDKLGITLNRCMVNNELKMPLRYPALFYRYLGTCRKTDVIFVPSFRHKDVPLAWLLARLTAKKVVFDPLVSRYETRVLDRGDVSPGSSQSWHNRNIDKVSFSLPDLLIADTNAHADFYSEQFGVGRDSIEVVPVGFDEDYFYEFPYKGGNSRTEVLFFGSFLPLHGVDIIVRAARILMKKPVRFTLVGRGQTYSMVREIAVGIPPDRIRFLEPVPQDKLCELVASADIVLGIFGTTPKTELVVPNKVFQAMAAGRSVITADTAAVREIFTSGEHLLTVPAGNPEALARAIELLRRDKVMRFRLGKDGGRYVRKMFNSVEIARIFLNALGRKGIIEGIAGE